MVDSVDSLSLYKKMKGKTISHYMGYYTAGAGIFRIRNTDSNVVKAQENLAMIKGQRLRKLKRPVTIVDNDILEVFTTVAGS